MTTQHLNIKSSFQLKLIFRQLWMFSLWNGRWLLTNWIRFWSSLCHIPKKDKKMLVNTFLSMTNFGQQLLPYGNSYNCVGYDPHHQTIEFMILICMNFHLFIALNPTLLKLYSTHQILVNFDRFEEHGKSEIQVKAKWGFCTSVMSIWSSDICQSDTERAQVYSISPKLELLCFATLKRSHFFFATPKPLIFWPCKMQRIAHLFLISIDLFYSVETTVYLQQNCFTLSTVACLVSFEKNSNFLALWETCDFLSDQKNLDDNIALTMKH